MQLLIQAEIKLIHVSKRAPGRRQIQYNIENNHPTYMYMRGRYFKG